MTEQLANFGHTTLAEPLDDNETGVDVASGAVFPSSGNFRVKVDDELMLVTSRATNTLTVQRGAEGTTPATHDDGAAIDAVLTAAGLAQAIAEIAPGREYSYVEFTSPVAVSATTEAGADVIVTAAEITFNGSTAIIVELWAPYIVTGSGTASVLIDLFDGSTALGITAQLTQSSGRTAGLITVRLTPSAAAHTYSWRAWRADSNGTIQAGAGGAGNYMPGYIRIIKA